MADADYAVKVNDQLESVELKLCGALGKNKQHGAHMRAFWASTISFFMAFVGWFALAPVAIEVCHSVGGLRESVVQQKRVRDQVPLELCQHSRLEGRRGGLPGGVLAVQRLDAAQVRVHAWHALRIHHPVLRP